MKKNRVTTVVVGFIETNCHIVASEKDNCVYIIDPGGEPDKILDAVKRSGTGFKDFRILVTHGHIDHIGAIRNLLGALPVSLFHLDKNDLFLYRSSENSIPPWLPAIKDPPEPFGDISGCEFEVLHTPGHTRGGVCYHFSGIPALFTGDTIFRHSVGRTDLPGGNEYDLKESIRRRIFTLPDNLRIFPGHGPETTVADEKRNNPFLV